MDVDNTWTNDSLGDAVVGAEAGGGPDFDENMGSWSGTRGSGAGSTAFSDAENVLEQTVSEAPSLRDHLLEQLHMDITEPAERVIGLHLIDRLDETGYLIGDLEEVAGLLGCDLAEVETVLAKLQAFDPPGLFARSLSECLALQLKDRNRYDPAIAALLDNLDLLARRDLAALRRVCGVDDEDLRDMIAEIRALAPKPALAFDHVVAEPVTPDVIMRANPGGPGWIVELNTDALPRVLVDNRYYAQLAGGARSKDDKTYISECLQTANWLVKSLHQRATTILKVASELVRQQEGFFLHGVSHLRPLVLRDIAEAIEMHESTVSRVTSNKYIATPRGIYEMKYFFTQAIASADGSEAHSAEAVRHRIKALIDAEDPKKILSDDKLVEMLNAEGIDIARRTVAKYREAMRIPSSVQRRREKRIQP